MARAFIPHVISRDSAIGGMDIPRSLRVDQGTSNVSDGSFYYRTFANSNKKTYTISVWFKKCHTVGNIGDDAYTMISCGGGGTGSYAGRFGFDIYAADQLNFNINNPAPTYHVHAKSAGKVRDNAWYHAVFAYDSTQATESNRMKMYINGELQTFDSPTYPSQYYDGYFNNNVVHRIGSTTSYSSGADLGQFNGYLAEFHFIDGQQLDSSYFGYTEQQTGIWRPKKFIPPNRPNNGVTWSSTTEFDANVFNGNFTNNFLAQVSNGYYTATTAPFTIKQSLGVITGDGYHWGARFNGSTEVTTGNLSNTMGHDPDVRIVNFDLSGVTLPLDVTNLQLKAGTGSSGSTYIYGIVVDGVVLLDANRSNIGLNGFYLNFSDNTSTTTIGYDYSGNANHFSPHDVVVGDSVPDSPTNDFCMMSGLNKNSGLSHGNLQFYKWNDSSAALVACQATMDIPNTGKWVWEQRWTGYQHTRYWAITRRMRAQGAYLDSSAYVYYDMYDGKTVSGLNGSVVTTLTGGQASYNDNVTRYWLMALDMDDMKARFYVNNVLQSTIAIPELPDDGKGNYGWTWTNSNGGSGSTYDDRFNFGQDATYFGAVALQNNYDASGLGQFYNTVPDGHKCLCTKNLQARTDVLVEPQKHFDTLLYTGNGSTLSVSGLKFQPDFVWIKVRSHSGDNHHLYDSVRGAAKSIFANTDDDEQTSDTDRLSSFTSNGFTLGSNYRVNGDGRTFVAWCWKAGGAAVSNSDGAITSSVSVNREAGFSIVSYSGNGNSTATIGHGLGKAPKWIMTKCRTSDSQADWVLWHVGLSDNKNVFLNQENAEVTPSYGHITDPTSTLINVTKSSGNQTNVSGQTYISYCWTDVPGYSKFGVHTGNGDDDGTNVVTGFKPAWLLIKNISSASTSWILKDTKIATSNVMQKALKANTTDAEASSLSSVDFLSNGFKIRNNGSFTNQSGDTYIYMAFADQTSLNQYNLAVNGR